MTSLTITLPIPDRSLSPNARVHWAALARARKKAKEAGFFAAMEAMKAVSAPNWASATVRATFYLRDRRGLVADQDNRIASLKGAIDGIAAAGVVVNDQVLQWLPVEHEVDARDPRVEVVITPTEAGEGR